MGLIHVLDEVTANQIAAGEVVERPVNVVKELVENSVDAGAHEVEIEIADGGMTYIRVTDNGSGMTAEDAKMSIIRHATSKISNVDNIYHIASWDSAGKRFQALCPFQDHPSRQEDRKMLKERSLISRAALLKTCMPPERQPAQRLRSGSFSIMFRRGRNS